MIILRSRPALVVDDVGSMTIMLTQVLRVIGFREVDRVVDVDSALERLRSKRYGLVLSDIQMKPTDGFALLRKVRCDPTTSSLPFIFFSGEISADVVERARMAGATGYIVKTSAPHGMVESIRDALSGAPGDAFSVAYRLPSLEVAEALIFGAEREPLH
ncbi:MAG: two-component system, chemotaxis family, chemotaxis protein CheY [Acidobacteriaceae bacterium]|jgi:two-component system chemotaxis response regulator CheY|nr:two-component system, chemotaxis family, chemotaxis protein CheY [Acidobacteriaceae bacterium]